MSHVDLYCDGSYYSRHKKAQTFYCGYAVSVVEQGIRTFAFGAGDSTSSPNKWSSTTAELLAFKSALNHALYINDQHTTINIYSDCETINIVLNKILQRITYGASNPYADVAHPIIWKQIMSRYALLDARVVIRHIESHMVGPRIHQHHAEVDKLAKVFATKRLVERYAKIAKLWYDGTTRTNFLLPFSSA
jgi:ribonuclease HI